MTDETKEILIGFIDYYNAMGTENDPGIRKFERLVQRASKELERHTKAKRSNRNSADVDPFGDTGEHLVYKSEEEW